MKHNKDIKLYLKIIGQIEKTRKKNNKNWMDLLRLSFKYNPNESKKILKEIFKEDKNVNSLVERLLKK
mgnify:CR=1 FL=1|tara:strand:- start:173 stop:376 length:204 start_codon:yes stop_codon:yes gene_type:complete